MNFPMMSVFNSSKMRSIGFFSVLLWPFCCKLVIHDIVNRASVKWLGEKRCGLHPAGSYEALRTLFPRTRVNSQHGQRSQPLQQVDSASNVRDPPTFNMISLHPRRCFFIVPCNIQLCMAPNLVDLYTNSIHTPEN